MEEEQAGGAKHSVACTVTAKAEVGGPSNGNVFPGQEWKVIPADQIATSILLAQISPSKCMI